MNKPTDKPHMPTPDRVERALRALLDISDKDWPRYRSFTTIGCQLSFGSWRERVTTFLAVADERHAELIAALRRSVDRLRRMAETDAPPSLIRAEADVIEARLAALAQEQGNVG